MFDIGFFELMIIFVIGLLVLGPERLPRVAGKIGNWVGQARRMTRNLKYQLEDELALQERKAAAEKFVSEIDAEIKGDTKSASPAESAQPSTQNSMADSLDDSSEDTSQATGTSSTGPSLSDQTPIEPAK